MRLWAVVKKEIIDNIRDRRSLFFALLYGPVLLPLLMLGPLAMGVQKMSVDAGKKYSVSIKGYQRVPNLVLFLKEHNMDVKAFDADDDYHDALRSRNISALIDISDDYELALSEGSPAFVSIYFYSKNDVSIQSYKKIEAVLQRYAQQIRSQRLRIRGIDTSLLHPLRVLTKDISSSNEADKIMARILPFIFVLSLIMGGFYLAVDSTAGERERHSLEPLLTLGLSRYQLVLAKYLAVLSFVFLSGFLVCLTTYILFQVIDVEALAGMLAIPFSSFARMFLSLIPLMFLFTSGMLAIATYAVNAKEAQTHLGLAMIVPMAPFFILQFTNISLLDTLFYIPVLGQFLLIERILESHTLPWVEFFHTVVGTLFLSLLLFYITWQRYRSERIV